MKQYMTIKECSNHFNKSTVWIRRMVHQGKLTDVKRERIGDTKVHRILISTKELSERLSTKSRSRRDDGRNKFNLYATSDEVTKIEKLFKDNNIESPFVRANPPKSK